MMVGLVSYSLLKDLVYKTGRDVEAQEPGIFGGDGWQGPTPVKNTANKSRLNERYNNICQEEGSDFSFSDELDFRLLIVVDSHLLGSLILSICFGSFDGFLLYLGSL